MPAPPIVVEHTDKPVSLPLINLDQGIEQRQANPTVDSIYRLDSHETFVVSLESKGKYNIRGTASAPRLASMSEYSDDPKMALAEFGARLMSLVNGSQGRGWDLKHNYRNIPDVRGIIEEVTLIKRRTEALQVQFSLTWAAGRGIAGYETPQARKPEVQDKAYLGGDKVSKFNLHEIEEMRMTKSQDIEVYAYVTATGSLDYTDNEILSKSGAKRRIRIKGNVGGDESVRTTFDNNVQSLIGTDKEYLFDPHYPCTPMSVTVESFDSSREAGQTQLGSYSLSLIEGGAFNSTFSGPQFEGQ